MRHQRLVAAILDLFPVWILGRDDRIADLLLGLSGRELLDLHQRRVITEVNPDRTFPVHRRQQLLHVDNAHCPVPLHPCTRWLIPRHSHNAVPNEYQAARRAERHARTRCAKLLQITAPTVRRIQPAICPTDQLRHGPNLFNLAGAASLAAPGQFQLLLHRLRRQFHRTTCRRRPTRRSRWPGLRRHRRRPIRLRRWGSRRSSIRLRLVRRGRIRICHRLRLIRRCRIRIHPGFGAALAAGFTAGLAAGFAAGVSTARPVFARIACSSLATVMLLTPRFSTSTLRDRAASLGVIPRPFLEPLSVVGRISSKSSRSRFICFNAST